MSTNFATIKCSLDDNQELILTSFAGPGKATPYHEDQYVAHCTLISIGNTGYSIQLTGPETTELIHALINRLSGNFEELDIDRDDLLPADRTHVSVRYNHLDWKERGKGIPDENTRLVFQHPDGTYSQGYYKAKHFTDVIGNPTHAITHWAYYKFKK